MLTNNSQNQIKKVKKSSFRNRLSGIEKIGIIGLSLLLIAGVLGSVVGDSIIKIFSTDYETNNQTNSINSTDSEGSLFSKLNPFANPSPDPTPQLSKEYIYAGSQMLAVEDANANITPPVDLAVWRPSSGTWWMMGGGVGSQQYSQQFGTNGDIPTQGDFDGDGKTDFCIYREVTNGNAEWWYMNSSDSTIGMVYFGLEDDTPAQADFDGDGRTDFAVFRDSNITWYYSESSTGNVVSSVFGASGDKPIPKDFDGDGQADIAVWRDSDATFRAVNSSNSQTPVIPYGIGGDKPVPADYDGDGRADVAVYRVSNATWYIQESSTSNNLIYQYGVSTDTLVPNDYDGDGKVDIAVWRGVKSSPRAADVGKWYIYQSSTSTTRTETWGIAGDIPVPSYYKN